MASSAPSSSAPVEQIVIIPADNGGFLAVCSKKASGGRSTMSMAEPSKHTFTDLAGLQGYLDETLGGGDASAGAPPSGPPMPSHGGPPMGGPPAPAEPDEDGGGELPPPMTDDEG